MATLKSLSLSGWKSIRQAQIDFGRVTVLIGANGSGKSNFISFFKLMNALAEGRLKSFVTTAGGSNSLLYYGAKTTRQIVFDLVLGNGLAGFGKYQGQLADTVPDQLIFTQENAGGQGGVNTLITGGTESQLTLSKWPEVTIVMGFLRSSRPYHINDTSSTALMRRTGYIEDNHALLPDAANLAAVLHRIQVVTPKVYQRIVSTIRQINPRFGDFDLKPSALNPTQIMLNWREKGQDMLFGPHQISDGTLRAMALVTLLLQPETDLPALLIIDEPELGLHPTAIGVIATLIRMASHHCQVIVATQSPQFLNEFEPAEVVVVDRRAEETTFSRPDEAGLAAWLEDFTLGELWQKNVLGGGPH